jgi:hypothetical protein
MDGTTHSLDFFMKDERLLESQHKWILNEETEDKILPTDSSLLLGEFQKSKSFIEEPIICQVSQGF